MSKTSKLVQGKQDAIKFSKSLNALDMPPAQIDQPPRTPTAPSHILGLIQKAQTLYNMGDYGQCLNTCERIYDMDASRTENLLLMGAVHFQLRNYSESVFYNQQCIRVDPNFAEAFSNLGNALKELGDLKGATQFYLKVR